MTTTSSSPATRATPRPAIAARAKAGPWWTTRKSEPLRYFLDAEFNGFGGELISLALAPEDGKRPFFYAAVECRAPTPWVAENVLPVLETDPLPRAEVARRFGAYLTGDEYPVLVADWPEDISHAANLLVTGPGRMSPIRSIRFEMVDPILIGAGRPSEVPHNAYHDACALRAAVLDYEKRMDRWSALGKWADTPRG